MDFIPLSIPCFEGNEKKYVDDALEQGWVSTGGAYITRLEKELSEYLCVPSVAACQSGTSAIHMSLIECGVRPGDTVIVPSLTFIAAVNPVSYQFANPVFMDCDDSLCMDPAKLRAFCEEECDFDEGVLKYNGSAVKAVVVVHVFGNMADMESIMDTAEAYNLKVIEDATEALGTRYIEGRYAGRFAGTIGDFGCYSFNGNKIITTGGGGAVTSRDPSGADHIRFLSTQAKTDPLFYLHDEIGYNYRMTNLQAALGVAQLEELETFIERKERNYKLYSELLSGFEYGSLLSFRENTRSNRWLYGLKLDMDKISKSVRDIVLALQDRKIQTRPIWGLINEQTPYRNCYVYKPEKAEYYAERILNIPSGVQLTGEEIKYVVKALSDVLSDSK